MPAEQIPQSSKIFYDPIANMLDRLCFQSQFSFTPNDFKNCYDMDMIRQSATGVCSTEVSFQIPSENLQPYQELHEDANSITIAWQIMRLSWLKLKIKEHVSSTLILS
jgi:hypothetical protein